MLHDFYGHEYSTAEVVSIEFGTLAGRHFYVVWALTACLCDIAVDIETFLAPFRAEYSPPKSKKVNVCSSQR